MRSNDILESSLLRLWMCGAIAAGLRALCGTSVRTAGFTFDGAPKIYYANHCSNLDFPVIWSCLPPLARMRTRPVAAKDYWSTSATRAFLAERVFQAIYVERGRASRAEHPIRAIAAALKDGSSVIIFPEGTRSRDGELHHFKSGLFHLARQFPMLDVVPVRLENLNRILPKGETLIVPLLSTVTFGSPIRLQDGETKPAFLGRAEQILKELQ